MSQAKHKKNLGSTIDNSNHKKTNKNDSANVTITEKKETPNTNNEKKITETKQEKTAHNEQTANEFQTHISLGE